MKLSDWVKENREQVQKEPCSRAAIRELVAIADREIGDAETVRSVDGQLEHAHSACLAIARAALKACGYRVRSQAEGHHRLTVASLEHTLGLPKKEVKELQGYRKKRSRAMYDEVGAVTDTEAQAALAAARRLRERLVAWLGDNYPNFAPKP